MAEVQPYQLDQNSSELFSDELKYRWMLAGLICFFLAAIFGSAMRYYFIAEIPFFEYKHILHAHSHIALLGWGYLFLSGAMLFLFLKRASNQKVYFYILVANIIAATGMAIFFLLEGYGPFSITFSTVHLITVYVFGWYFLKDLKHNKSSGYVRFAKWSIVWVVVSTLGLWAIAPVSVWLGKAHPLYYMSIQFFLHFQFNGWFTYGILALLFFYISQRQSNVKVPNGGFWILQLSLLLTYALSITWSTPLSIIFYLNSLGVILQAVAYYLIFKSLFKNYNPFKKLNHWSDWLLMLGVACLFAKVLAQIVVAIPAVATISYTIRNYVIGFIHLVMLGSVTFTGVAILLKYKLLPQNSLSKAGWLILGLGFVSTELLLFGQGTLLWMRKGFINYYYEIILAATLLLPAGLATILAGYRRCDFKPVQITINSNV